jgi:hypothetical protein
MSKWGKWIDQLHLNNKYYFILNIDKKKITASYSCSINIWQNMQQKQNHSCCSNEFQSFKLVF